MQAAHDAGQCHHLAGVGDDQGIAVQGQFGLVQQGQGLTRARVAYFDVTVEPRQVEGVHGLAEFEHHVVGDVDGRRNRADAAATQFLDHPLGRARGGVDAGDDPARVAGLTRFVADPHRQLSVGLRRDRIDLRRVHGDPVARADLARDPAHAQAVAAVGREIDLHQQVIQAQVGVQVDARGRVGGQHHQAGAIVGQAQFALRAQHALGLHAAQFGHADLDPARQPRPGTGEGHAQTGGDVGRAADHLEGIVGPGRDLADPQLGRTGMLGGAQNVADDHAAEIAGGRLDRVDFQPQHGQLADQGVRPDCYRSKAAPGQRGRRPAINGTGAESADRFRRTGAGRPPRNAASPGARPPCRRHNR